MAAKKVPAKAPAKAPAKKPAVRKKAAVRNPSDNEAAIEATCQEYVLNGGDQSKAYRKGFPRSTKWTNKSVHERASKLFRMAKVKSRVAELKEQARKIAEERFNIDASYVLEKLVNDIEADLADLYHPSGALKPIHDWPMVWRQGLVSGVDVHQEFSYIDGDKIPDGVVTKLKLSERVKRLELLGRHTAIQAWKDNSKVEVVETDLVDKLNAALARAGK